MQAGAARQGADTPADSAEAEFQLIERVLLHFASANGHEQLETVLDRFLAPCLRKLSSDKQPVRTKIMELLVHVNKRLKSSGQQLQLPMNQLLALYESGGDRGGGEAQGGGASASFVRNFAYVYLKMGFQRMPAESRASTALPLLLALQKGPRVHTDAMLTPIVSALAERAWQAVDDGGDAESCRRLLSDHPSLTQLLVRHIEDMLLLPYGLVWPSAAMQTAQPSSSPAATTVPAGMSLASVRRVLSTAGDASATTPVVMPASELERLKGGALRWLETAAAAAATAGDDTLPSSVVLPAALIGASDTRFSVAEPACHWLDQLAARVDWSSAGTLCRRLCAMFHGDSPTVDSATVTAATTNGERRQPAGVRLRLKLLPLLTHHCADFMTAIVAVQLVAAGLFGAGTTAKLRTAAMLLAVRVASQASSERTIKSTSLAAASVLLGCARRVLNEPPQPPSGGGGVEALRLRAAAFTTVEKLVTSHPTLLVQSPLVMADLLSLAATAASSDGSDADSAHTAVVGVSCVAGRLACESPEVGATLEHQLHAAAVVSQSDAQDLLPSRFRRTLLLCWAKAFACTHARSRLQLLKATGDSNQLVAEEARRQLGFDGGSGGDFGSTAPADQRQLPSFDAMLACVELDLNGCNDDMSDDRQAGVTGGSCWPRLSSSPAALELAVRYLSACLRLPSAVQPERSSDEHFSNGGGSGSCFVMDDRIVGRSAHTLSLALADGATGESDACCDDLLVRYVRVCRRALCPGLCSIGSGSSGGGGGERTVGALFCLLEVVASLPLRRLCAVVQLPTETAADSQRLLGLDWLEQLLTRTSSSSGAEFRRYAAELYGIVFAATAVSAAADVNHLAAIVTRLTDSACGTKKLTHLQPAYLLTVAHSVSEWWRLHKATDGFIVRDASYTLALDNVVAKSFHRLLTCHLLEHTTQHSPLLDTTCEAIGIVMAAGDGAALFHHGEFDSDGDERQSLLSRCAERLASMIGDEQAYTTRLRELAANAAAGLLSIVGGAVCPGSAWRRRLCQRLLATAGQLQQFELQVAVGEALASAVCGPSTQPRRRRWLQQPPSTSSSSADNEDELELCGSGVDEPMPVASADAQQGGTDNDDVETLDWLLRHLVHDSARQTPDENDCRTLSSPRARLSVCLWLMVVLKRCVPQLQRSKTDWLSLLQRWLIERLTERGEVLHEASARGLMFAYAAASDHARPQLLHALIAALSGGLASVQRADSAANNRDRSTDTSSTTVAVGIVSSSGSSSGRLSLYRQICALATHAAQPQLVYPLMSLAESSAVWSTRRGASIVLPSVVRLSSVIAQITSNCRGVGGDRSLDVLLLPRLYRHQFDPSSADAQRCWRDIWRALVATVCGGSGGAARSPVLTHCGAICDALCGELTQADWRVRQACATGVGELFTAVGGCGMQATPLLDRLPALWPPLARVCDDLKESVRTAALTSLRVVCGVFVRACADSADYRVAERALSTGLTTLVMLALGGGDNHSDDGTSAGCDSSSSAAAVVESMDCCAEVRRVCLGALARLVQQVPTAGDQQLRRQLPQLVEQLLVQLSELEPRQLRYLSVRLAGGGQQGQVALDRARLAAVKESAAFGTLMQCARRVDSPQLLARLSERLARVMRRNSGLAAKCGAALFIGRVCCERPTFAAQSVEDRDGGAATAAAGFLSTLLHGVKDSNQLVAETCASTCGVACRFAAAITTAAADSRDGGSGTGRVLRRVTAWYVNSLTDDAVSVAGRRLRALCGRVMAALAHDSSDQLRAHGIDAVAVVFVATHERASPDQPAATAGPATAAIDDRDELEQRAATHWRDAWHELTSGGGCLPVSAAAVLRVHRDEVLTLCRRLLSASSWPARGQAARALAAAVRCLVSPQCLADDAADALLTALDGRVWCGKEHVLTALADVCACVPRSALTCGERAADAVVRETTKAFGSGAGGGNQEARRAYRVTAVRVCGDVLHSCRVDRFERMFRTIGGVINGGGGGTNDNSDSDDEMGGGGRSSASDRRTAELQAAIVTALARAWPLCSTTQCAMSGEFLAGLKTLWTRAAGRPVHKAIVTALETIVPQFCWLSGVQAQAGEQATIETTVDSGQLLEWLCPLVWLLSQAVVVRGARPTIFTAVKTAAALVDRLGVAVRQQTEPAAAAMETGRSADEFPATQVINMLRTMLRPALLSAVDVDDKHQALIEQTVRQLDGMGESVQ